MAAIRSVTLLLSASPGLQLERQDFLEIDGDLELSYPCSQILYWVPGSFLD